VIKRTPHNFAVLNLYPYNNGHVMIIPCRHVDRIEKMTDAEKVDWLDLAENVRTVLEKTMKAQGFNMGINMGRAAGAGIPKHLHLHIVPRWKGDVNFMPLIGETKVISESLDSAYKILAGEMKKRPAGRLGR
jgi:ATP adenylyltransferase